MNENDSRTCISTCKQQSMENRVHYGLLISITLICVALILAGATYVALQANFDRQEYYDKNAERVDNGAFVGGVQYGSTWGSESRSEPHTEGDLPDGYAREATERSLYRGPDVESDSWTPRNHDNVMADSIPDPTKWPEVSDEDLAAISQSLWNLDHNRIPLEEYDLNPQERTNKSSREDVAPNRLFTRMEVRLSTFSGTFSRFLALLDNYNALVRSAEEPTSYNLQEVADFLDSVMDTDVMRELGGYLRTTGFIEPRSGSFREKLQSLWFEPYSRRNGYNETDSSGFEHVFVGEIRGGRVIGLHNWIQIYLQERTRHLDYQGYITFRSDMPRFINVRLTWHGRMKRQSSFLVGVSPEYDLALYTLCALTRLARDCPVFVDGHLIIIHAYDINHVPSLQIATAFADLPEDVVL